MKKNFLFVLCFFMMTMAYSQMKNSYTVSGGILGAANFTDFMVRETEGGSHNAIDYNTKTGWAIGGWVNFPVCDYFSIEPQLLYSVHRYFTNSTSPNVLMKDGKIGYVSVPVVFKAHLGDHFALTGGPQVDFVSSIKNNSGSTAQRSDFNKAAFSGFAGIEVMPHGRLTFFGRYIHGFSNMSRVEGAGVPKYKNQNIQVGLKLRLFGKKKEAPAAYQAAPAPPPPPVEEVVVTAPPKPDPCALDTDGDGVKDCNDKCLNVVGVARYDGCPIPDRDGDGINDEEDKCPDVAGIAANNGCPEIKEVSDKITRSISMDAQNIQFTGSTTKFTTRSNASLNSIVTILNENPDLKVKIEGHTDNVGDDVVNMTLSTDRAAAVKAYFVSKGISEDRITIEGFGETTPIADNNTAAGRVKNRRVEVKVTY
jgi:outer membrane protein OmpA-like peptidoglycan-associated protein